MHDPLKRQLERCSGTPVGPGARGPAAGDDAGPVPVSPPRGRETVLLVEDEDVVRGVTGEMLGLAGYTVLAARDGREAVRLCEVHAGAIALLMTDLVMPGMGGRELAVEVRARRPDVHVLYTSGYFNDTPSRDGSSGVAGEFLQKPFSVEALALKVRQVLDARRGTSAQSVPGGARATARPVCP